MRGRLEVKSDPNGTVIRAVIPVSASIEAKESGQCGIAIDVRQKMRLLNGVD